jgi:hypothetical protein
MANTLKIKRGTAATIPQGQLAEPLFTSDTYDLYIGKGGALGNQRFQKYIASGTSSQFLKGDGSLDSTTYQATSEKGQNNGYASLDAGGKIPAAQLPSSVIEYKGTWNASTNTPTLADGTGDAGDVYIVSVGGTQNLGSGSITFDAGDWVMYNGSVWQKSTGSNAVASVNGQTGIVSIGVNDLDDATITSPSNGQLLQYSTGTNKWINWTPTYISAAITSLNGLTAATQTFANDTNVTITSATSTHTIGWSGQLSIARGGTGLSALGTAGQLLRVNSGATALEYFTPTYISAAITSLNGLTAATQTFATGSSGTDFNISSTTSTHTFNIPSASAANRGLVTTGTQTFAGDKTFTNQVLITTTYPTTLVPFIINNSAGYGFYNGAESTLDFNYGRNDTSTGYINYTGYQGGATQFRNLIIANGKGATIATFTGSTKELSLSGTLNGISGVFNSNFNIHKNGSNTVGSGGYFALYNAATTDGMLWQLNGSNNIDFWGLTSNSFTGSPIITFTRGGASTFASTATATAFIPTGSTVPTNGMYLPSANTLGLSANSTKVIEISDSGRVSIGATSPTTDTLTVHGKLTTTNGGDITAGGQISSGSTISSGLNIIAVNTISGSALIPTGTTAPTVGMYLVSGTSTLNGVLGFSTGSTKRFEISSTGAATFSGDVLVTNSSNAQIGFNTTGALNTTGAYQYYNRSGSNKWTAGMGPLDGSDDYQIVTAGIKALNLKVSTGAATFNTSASTAISVNSTGTASGIQLKNTGGTASDWIIQSDGGAVAGQAAFRIYSVTASQYRMSIDGSGNVGIGTTSPTNGKLEIQQGATTAALWAQTGGTTSSYVIADFRTGTNLSALQIQGNGSSIFGGNITANSPSAGNTGEGIIAGTSFKIDASGTGQKAKMYVVSKDLSDTYGSGLQIQFANQADDKGFGFNLTNSYSGAFELYLKNSGSWAMRYRFRPSGRTDWSNDSYMVSGTNGFRFNDSTDAFNNFIALDNGNATLRGTLTQNSSDRRLKTNIVNIQSALDKIKLINGVTFDWIDNIEQIGLSPTLKYNDAGVIAQEIQAVLPQAVDYAPFDLKNGISVSGNNYLTVQYEKIVPLLIEAIKELNAKLEAK